MSGQLVSVPGYHWIGCCRGSRGGGTVFASGLVVSVRREIERGGFEACWLEVLRSGRFRQSVVSDSVYIPSNRVDCVGGTRRVSETVTSGVRARRKIGQVIWLR